MPDKVPLDIYKKLRRFQPLTDDEIRLYGDLVDWRLAYQMGASSILEIFLRATTDFSRDEGWLGSAEGLPSTPDHPRPNSIAEAKDALWDWLGGPQAGKGRRRELATFIAQDYARFVEDFGGDRLAALKALADQRGKTPSTMRRQLGRLGVKNLPFLDET